MTRQRHRGRYGSVITVLALILCLGGCATVRHKSSARAEPLTAAVSVIRRGRHIDIAIPAQQLNGALHTIRDVFPGAQWILFGFGDRRYLMSKHPHWDAVLAALGNGAGLMLVTGLTDSPEKAFSPVQVRTLQVSAAQAQLVDAQLWLAVTQNGEPQRVADGPYPGSLFFATSLRYSALHTCNTWAAEVLRAAGLPIRSRGTIFANQLWWQIQSPAATGNSEAP